MRRSNACSPGSPSSPAAARTKRPRRSAGRPRTRCSPFSTRVFLDVETRRQDRASGCSRRSESTQRAPRVARRRGGTRDSHAEYLAALADRTDAEVAQGGMTPERLNRIRAELDFPAALALARESGPPVLQLRLALGLAQACEEEGRASEPRAALEDTFRVARLHPRNYERGRSGHSPGRRSARTISTSPRTPQAQRLNSYEDKATNSVSPWL